MNSAPGQASLSKITYNVTAPSVESEGAGTKGIYFNCASDVTRLYFLCGAASELKAPHKHVLMRNSEGAAHSTDDFWNFFGSFLTRVSLF